MGNRVRDLPAQRRKAKHDKEIEDRVRAPLKWWADFLGLSQSWEISTVIVDSISGQTAGGYTSFARITIQDPYRRAFIEILGSAACSYTDRAIERSVLHELIHIVFNDLDTCVHNAGRPNDREILHEHIESLSDVFSIALLRLKYGEDYVSVETEVE